MMNKKFFKISLVIALMAGIVTFYSCDNDDLTPSQDGRNLAQELCDCFIGAGEDVNRRLACIADFENKANRWRGNDREALQVAFDEAIKSCAISPLDWYYAHLAVIAAAEFCALAAQHPDGDMMILAPLYMRYEAELNSGNPAFLEPFFEGLMACLPNSDWILCTFRIMEFCPDTGLTDEQLAALGKQAAEKLCDCFTEAANLAAEEACMMVITPYVQYMGRPEFTGALTTGLRSCSSAPDWVLKQFGGGH